jgi:hypothetical protein
MMTVKHISQDNGNELVIQAIDACFHRSSGTVYVTQPRHQAEPEVTPFTEGRVFLMNEDGKTVSTWDLRTQQSASASIDEWTNDARSAKFNPNAKG